MKPSATCKLVLLLVSVVLTSCIQAVKKEEISEYEILRHDRPEAPILKGVTVPHGRSYYFSSGIVAPVADEAATGTARYGGDTYAQSIKTLGQINDYLKEEGLRLQDVITLKVYIAPDPATGTRDFDGWFKAYGEFFNNTENPNKVARTTLGVAELAKPGILVEVEAIAVYPN